MRTNLIAVSSILALCVLAAGCGHGKKAAKETIAADTAFADSTSLGTSDTDTAQGLRTVRFPFDSHLLSEETKSTLADNAAILLKDHPKMRVQIEGHCDQRGGIQYNIALGERRASAVRSYLVGLGVPADRLTVVSYGKERPLVPGDGEESYQKNRRANFSITAR